jgi:hypothetical protein
MTNGESLAKMNQRTITSLIAFLVWIVFYHSTSCNAFVLGVQTSQSPKTPSKTILFAHNSPAITTSSFLQIPDNSPAITTSVSCSLQMTALQSSILSHTTALQSSILSQMTALQSSVLSQMTALQSSVLSHMTALHI